MRILAKFCFQNRANAEVQTFTSNIQKLIYQNKYPLFCEHYREYAEEAERDESETVSSLNTEVKSEAATASSCEESEASETERVNRINMKVKGDESSASTSSSS